MHKGKSSSSEVLVFWVVVEGKGIFPRQGLSQKWQCVGVMVLEVRNIRLKIRLDEPEHYIVKVLASDLFVEDLNKRQSKYI